MGDIRLKTPALSPDTALVAYVRDTSYTRIGDIWVVGTGRDAQPRHIAVGLSPTWSPDGRQLAFQGLDASQDLQIFVWDRARNALRQVTHLPRGTQPNWYVNVWLGTESARLSWSPDGQKVLFASKIPDPNALPVGDSIPYIVTEKSPAVGVWAPVMRYMFGGWRYEKGKSSWDAYPTSAAMRITNEVVQLCIADMATGEVVQLTHDSAGAFDAAWSPDGTAIVFESNEGAPMMASRLRATNLYTVRADGSGRTALTSGAARKYFPVWSADGRTIAYQNAPSGSYYSIGTVLVDRESKSVVTDSARVQAVLARAFPITVRPGVMTTPDNKRVELHLTSGKPRILVEVPPHADETVATTRSDTVQRIEWIGARGTKLHGRLRLPLHYEAGKRYPMVVDPYAEWQTPDTLTAAGYIVFSPSPRMPHDPGNGDATAAAYRKLAVDSPRVALQVSLEDVMSGVDTLIRRGLADSSRMALVGFSNGGGAVNYLVTLTDRFKCAVAQSPAAGDLTSVFFTDPDGEYLLTFFNGNAPWDKPEVYSILSPVNSVDKVHTPMLYAYGETEGFVFASGALEMYDGLRRLKRPVTVVEYPGQYHGLTGWAETDLAIRARKFIDACTAVR
jgi:dipeptidyl aminopeptidase/acylaminoacyl peptidase